MPNPNTPMFLRLADVCVRISLSRATVYNKINAASPYYDPSFPTARRVGDRSVRWLPDDVDAWINSRSAN